ncbi:hypothetical protein FQZ97_747640 [compost metagenome]
MGDDLEHHLAGQQAQPRVLGLAEQRVQGSGQCRAGGRCGAVVQGETAALVLAQDAGLAARQGLQPLTHGSGQRRRLLQQRLVGMHAPLGTVDAAGGQPQRREESVEIVERAAADQRQRTAEAAMQALQGRAQFARNADRSGGFGDIQKGAVDIEKQRASLPAVAQPGVEPGTCRSPARRGTDRAGWSLNHWARHGPISTLPTRRCSASAAANERKGEPRIAPHTRAIDPRTGMAPTLLAMAANPARAAFSASLQRCVSG